MEKLREVKRSGFVYFGAQSSSGLLAAVVGHEEEPAYHEIVLYRCVSGHPRMSRQAPAANDSIKIHLRSSCTGRRTWPSWARCCAWRAT